MARTDMVAQVLFQKRLTKDILLLRVHASDIARAARPGQFCMLQATCSDSTFDPLLRRPLSIHNVHAERGVLEFLYRNVGRGTSLLSRLKANDQIRIMGPLGNGFMWHSATRHILVGGGMGIAPLLFLAWRIKAQGLRPRVILGAATAEELVQRDAFFEVAGEEQLFFATEDGSLGHEGLVTEPLEALLRDNASDGTGESAVLTCGPFPMMRAVAALARDYGVACQVSLEAKMACGSGLCLGCAVPGAGDESGSGYLHVCREGPVVDAEEVKW